MSLWALRLQKRLLKLTRTRQLLLLTLKDLNLKGYKVEAINDVYFLQWLTPVSSWPLFRRLTIAVEQVWPNRTLT